MKIELCSDLCAADGDGYASVIDTDIVVDQYGIPYLPARRLKGCLREAAEYIQSNRIKEIFGVSGNRYSGSLRISNARISEYQAFLTEIRNREQFSNAQKVTELFTMTSASTAVEENGSAKENSLRFMRYVSGNSPWNTEKPLIFYADVRIDSCYAEEFSRICKALRHIGYKRNRGFGAVKCVLEEVLHPEMEFSVPENLSPEGTYVLHYAVKLEENLMLPSKTADETQDNIPGQAVLGLLANAYLKEHSADEGFKELFLNPEVKYSDLHLTDADLTEYIPVPMYLGKSKNQEDAGKILDMTDETKTKEKIIKPVKKGYISSTLHIRETLTERVYHNAVHGDGLYTQSCMQSGQLFRGTITANGKYLTQIASLLLHTDIIFGRSRSAQYAECSLIAFQITPYQEKKITIEKGQHIVYALDSDVILLDDDGNADISCEALCRALHVNSDKLSDRTALKNKTITGFLSVMRLQKAHLQAFAAGSVLILKAEKTVTLPECLYIGEKQNEGYGKIRIFPSNALLNGQSNQLSVPEWLPVQNQEISEFFKKKNIREEIRLKAIASAKEWEYQFMREWNPAFLGRITLMTEEAANLKDLKRRILSIKSVSKRTTTDKWIKDLRLEQYHDWQIQKEYLLTILTIVKYRFKQNATAKGGRT